MDDAARRNRLRSTFGLDAERYDRARPGYPEALFVDLAHVARLAPGSRVLEIGPGTGQATVPLAAMGCEVVAVELSPELAAVARRNLSAYPNASVAEGSFEAWDAPRQAFDAVVAATAFHWIDPAVRLAKSAALLRPGGTLAVIDTEHVAGESDFFDASQRCYERWDPGTKPGVKLAPATEVGREWKEIQRAELFRPLGSWRYEWEATYSTAEYLELLSTYSGHIGLADEARSGLFGCLEALIEGSYRGAVIKRYLTILRMARRQDSASHHAATGALDRSRARLPSLADRGAVELAKERRIEAVSVAKWPVGRSNGHRAQASWRFGPWDGQNASPLPPVSWGESTREGARQRGGFRRELARGAGKSRRSCPFLASWLVGRDNRRVPPPIGPGAGDDRTRTKSRVVV